MAQDKIRYAEDVLKKARPRINFDFRPSSYYYAIIYWSSQFRDSLMTSALRKVSGKVIWAIFALAGICILLSGFRKKTDFTKVTLAGICVMGFSQAAIQIMLLFSFQIIYGYLYFMLGVLFTSFMLGLALAGWYEGRADHGAGKSRTKIIFYQLSIAIYAFIFPAAVNLLSLARANYLYQLGAFIFFF